MFRLPFSFCRGEGGKVIVCVRGRCFVASVMSVCDFTPRILQKINLVDCALNPYTEVSNLCKCCKNLMFLLSKHSP